MFLINYEIFLTELTYNSYLFKTFINIESLEKYIIYVKIQINKKKSKNVSQLYIFIRVFNGCKMGINKFHETCIIYIQVIMFNNAATICKELVLLMIQTEGIKFEAAK